MSSKLTEMTLLHFSNKEFETGIKEAYRNKISVDSFEWITARIKIFNNIKSYKNKTIDRMNVSLKPLFGGSQLILRETCETS